MLAAHDVQQDEDVGGQPQDEGGEEGAADGEEGDGADVSVWRGRRVLIKKSINKHWVDLHHLPFHISPKKIALLQREPGRKHDGRQQAVKESRRRKAQRRGEPGRAHDDAGHHAQQHGRRGRGQGRHPVPLHEEGGDDGEDEEEPDDEEFELGEGKEG